jgi:small subunit ribosomal protein S16
VAVKIRLMRMGKKKQPSYRVVVADSRSPRDGRFIEIIGHYGPRQDSSVINIDGDKALSWLRKGAQPTEQVQKLLTVTGVWAQFESEKSRPIDTKLNRRRLGDPKADAKKAKKQEAAVEAQAEAKEEPTAEAAAAEAPGAAEASAGEEAPADEADAEESGDE